MHFSHFDIAIAGDSLAARMTAALLAKHGKRLLLLTTSAYRDPWQFSSLFTEQLFGILGGRDCLGSSQPFQVLSSRARVTIHPDVPLDTEFTREFGSAAAQLSRLLDEFERSGTALEELFWQHGGLPLGGLRDTAAWRWLCLRRKVPLAPLTKPLAERLHGIPEPAGEWLRDLFQGLALQPVSRLTVADAALLWTYARRPTGIAGDTLDELLQRRFEQFHGTSLPMDTVATLTCSHGQWNGQFADGRRFQAGQLIVGDLDRQLPGHGPLPVRQTFPPAGHFVTTTLDGQVSALLEQRVVVGGPLPLRLSLVATPQGRHGDIGSGTEAEPAAIQAQLEPILPFARYTLVPRTSSQQLPEAPASPSLFKLSLQLGSHLWCADDTRLLPQLGNGGAALLAWTLVRQLDPAIVATGD